MAGVLRVLALGNTPAAFGRGPGINNTDLTLFKNFKVKERVNLRFQIEAYNVFNHTQFYGAAAVDGEVNDPHFGSTVSAATPRLVQLAIKFAF